MHSFGGVSIVEAGDDVALPGHRVILAKYLDINLFPENFR